MPPTSPTGPGGPDQGYEGFRFVGFSIYDSLIEWDLSHSDRAADIRPASRELVDRSEDHKTWIFKLRKGVKFHDGCDWNADSAVWNFDRVMDPAAPQYNVRHSRQCRAGWSRISTAIEKIDDYTIAAHTKIVDSLLPYEITGYFQVSKCAVTKANNDYTAYRQGAGRHRTLQVRQGGAA